MKDLSSIADKVSFPKDRLVKHYGGPAALEQNYDLQVSILASKSNINTSAQFNLPFMMETDYLDDPNRPGAVLGPKTVPKRTKISLENNLINEDMAYQIHESLPDSIYKSFN
jgi:TatD-related deoxyribonuclease